MSLFTEINRIPEPGPLVSEVSAKSRSNDRHRRMETKRRQKKSGKKPEPKQTREPSPVKDPSLDVDRYI
ncbi:MAG: hypothetical protein JRD68_04075 [Deltaproteobacteria bacterium]|nr:hypothetical protein [Deltaproteobacteria bacterium]